MDKEKMFDEENIILSHALKVIQKSKDRLLREKDEEFSEALKQQEYYWDTRMDDMEKLQARSLIDSTVDKYLEILQGIYKRDKMLKSPYYGRIDFQEKEESEAKPYYIGLFGFKEEDSPFILDWRTPLGSVFYDHEIGNIEYDAPSGKIEGNLKEKRQLKITDGKLEYCINSSLKIDDDILQQALANNTSEKMQNVVSTIQKEQNQIIRMPYQTSVIVQGVAGSGKTSIALHRVAFLLYRNNNKLNYKNMMILSPNKVFEDYISTVLPELGEQNVQGMSLDTVIQDYFYLANEEVESKAEQYERLIALRSMPKDTAYKNSPQIVEDLTNFLKTSLPRIFTPKDLNFQELFISKEEIEDVYYKQNPDKTHKERVQKVIKLATRKYMLCKSYSETALQGALNSKIKSMTTSNATYKIYREFLKSKGFSFEKLGDKKIKYEDAFAIMFIDDFVNKLVPDQNTQHLIIDEMQDYSPMQYCIIEKLFPCSKTILGDWGQSMDPYSSKQSILYLPKVIKNSVFLQINKCYRSGAEIGKLCNSIGRRTDVELVRTTGGNPVIRRVDDLDDLMNEIDLIGEECRKNQYKNVAIITKNLAEAKFYYNKLKEHMTISLLTDKTEKLPGGLIVTPSFQGKGLEFDCVIIPDACDSNYNSSMEQQNLYVSCTRALHSLNIFYSGSPSRYLANYMNNLTK